MNLLSALKPLLALALTVAVLLMSSTAGQTASGSPTVTVTAVSGFDGHAFVYAEVQTATASFPAPTGTTHQSPYFAEWVPVALGGANCPWVWTVYVFNRATNALINPSPPNAPLPNFGTTTVLCPAPSKTPVGQPPMSDASARLDLDLQVSVSPASAVAGSASSITATLSSALTADLNLYMNLAIEDWHVDSWYLDYGDGQSAALPGGTTAIASPHIFQTAGQYNVQAIASISGHAQAAVYDHYGRPALLQQGFALQIGNHVSTSASPRPVRRYLPPSVGVAVSPALSPSRPDPSAAASQRINTYRGRLTVMALHLLVFHDGLITVDGRAAGAGRSSLIGWRFDGVAADAPPGSGTTPGAIHAATDDLLLQWNSPNHLAGNQQQDYVVPLTLFVRTQYSDGHTTTYVIASSFRVSVNFAAESG